MAAAAKRWANGHPSDVSLRCAVVFGLQHGDARRRRTAATAKVGAGGNLTGVNYYTATVCVNML